MTGLNPCENCERQADCVRTVLDQTDQCCRCRGHADSDGYCDDCRPDGASGENAVRCVDCGAILSYRLGRWFAPRPAPGVVRCFHAPADVPRPDRCR